MSECKTSSCAAETAVCQPGSRAMALDALRVLDLIAQRLASGQSVVLNPEWEYGTGALVFSDGSCIQLGRVGSDNRDQALRGFVDGLHAALLTQQRGSRSVSEQAEQAGQCHRVQTFAWIDALQENPPFDQRILARVSGYVLDLVVRRTSAHDAMRGDLFAAADDGLPEYDRYRAALGMQGPSCWSEFQFDLLLSSDLDAGNEDEPLPWFSDALTHWMPIDFVRRSGV